MADSNMTIRENCDIPRRNPSLFAPSLVWMSLFKQFETDINNGIRKHPDAATVALKDKLGCIHLPQGQVVWAWDVELHFVQIDRGVRIVVVIFFAFTAMVVIFISNSVWLNVFHLDAPGNVFTTTRIFFICGYRYSMSSMRYRSKTV